MKNRKIIVQDLGRTSFSYAWEYQEKIFQKVIDQKIQNRKSKENIETDNYLIFTEHNPVYTIGKSGKISNLLIHKEELEKNNIDFFKINRGGDITFHGPGQIMGYPIIDLDNFFTDINLYLRNLEKVIIDTLSFYEIDGFTIKNETGVWVKNKNEFKKICAFGIRASRWVTMHGFCLNVNPNLDYFKNIIPCGISDKGVTSIYQLNKEEVDLNNLKSDLLKNFKKTFDCDLII
jgi:lipoyl(octanoyl) transferase